MANCPNCGFDHIQLKRETNVNWGRAVAGWALFGVVGGAVGAITGEDRNVNACLDCGSSWKAADLHKILQIIKNFTGLKLDLSEEANRIYINDFIREFSPDLESIANIEKESKKLIADIEAKSGQNSINGCAGGCVTSFLLLGAISAAGPGFALLLLILPIAAASIGYQMDKSNEKNIKIRVEQIKQETVRKSFEAENKLKIDVIRFTKKYFLIDSELEKSSVNMLEEVENLSKFCPRCNDQLPPPFQSSGRIVCSNCGWSNKSKK